MLPQKEEGMGLVLVSLLSCINFNRNYSMYPIRISLIIVFQHLAQSKEQRNAKWCIAGSWFPYPLIKPLKESL